MSSAIGAAAATFTVTNKNNRGDGSLRQTISDANCGGAMRNTGFPGHSRREVAPAHMI